MKAVEEFRKGFTDIFDSHGKFKKHYVENLEMIAVKHFRDCKDCKHEPEKGDVFARCNGCKHNYNDLFEGV